MSVPDSSWQFACNIFVSLSYATISYLLGRAIFCHWLTIGHLSPSSAHNIRLEVALYSKTYKFICNASSLTWTFHLPRTTSPRWCTITVDGVLFTSTTGNVSVKQFEIILWFFPVFFRQTAGPWANVTFVDLSIEVLKSTETPYWIGRLRESLVNTMLTGTTLRADVFRTSLHVSELTERPEEQPTQSDSKSSAVQRCEEGRQGDDQVEVEGYASGRDKCGKFGRKYEENADSWEDGDEFRTRPLQPCDKDELRFSMLARQLHMTKDDGRIYSFGRFDSQVRRAWLEDRGSLAMTAEESRWIRVPFPFELVPRKHWLKQLASSLLNFPSDLLRSINYPASSVNLYVTRLDVTFDSFRLRDAELLRQGMSLLVEAKQSSGVDWSEAFLDALTQILAPR